MKSIFFTLVLFLSMSIQAEVLERTTSEIVIDSTGLQWQDNQESKTLTLNWIKAIEYCQSLELGEYNDWRLPNINELKSIYYVETGGVNSAIIAGFLHNSNYLYWSSTTVIVDKDWSWIVEGIHGLVYSQSKYESNHIRCVRDDNNH